MLISLSVKNLALIDKAEVEFSKGLNIITGETGAGKSIIIGSVNLALGGRVSKEIIRQGAEYAMVEMVFELDSKYQKIQLEKMDIFCEDNQLIISRKITPTRTVSKINGETVTMATLKNVAEIVIDIHGQHEHQSLLNKNKHLQILDEFAKDELDKPKKKVEEFYRAYVGLQSELENMDLDEKTREREISFLQYEIQEIEEANLTIGEDLQLEDQYKRMMNGQKIKETLGCVYGMLEGNDGVCAESLIGNSVREISSITSLDKEIESFYEQLSSVESLLGDLNREIISYIDNLDFDEEDYHNITNRLDLINHLKSKYGNSIEEILNSCNEKQKRCDELINYAQNIEAKKVALDKCVDDYKKASAQVTKIRKQYGAELTKEIKEALLDMNFLDVQFNMLFKEKNTFSVTGVDEAEFVISTNPGEIMQPLGKIASGGELSRIMLAIKTVLAKKDFVNTMIFDEIDVGISGRTAQKISEKMGMLAKDKQIICITHLPQIAAMSDCHFLIEKNTENDGKIKTKTTIHRLTEDEITMELARLLGGVKITDTVLESAKEMRNLAKS